LYEVAKTEFKYTRNRRVKKIDSKGYNEEFDPGSGRTLAAGLTHASRRVVGSNTDETGARVRNT
jgi:hypothetical protein